MTDSESEVDHLWDGEHGCLTFSDPDERLDTVSDFIGSSLERGLKVLCIVDAHASQTMLAALAGQQIDADAAAATEQLLIRSSGGPFGEPGSADTVTDLVTEVRRAARWEGFPELRLSLDMQWAADQRLDPAGLAALEKSIGELVAASDPVPLTVLCQYDRQAFSTDSLDLAADVHSRSLAAATYHHDAMLHISRPQGSAGLRIAGELDYARLDPLATALDEALRIDQEVHLDLRHLRFVDVPTAYAVIAAAGRMKPDQRMVISGGARLTDMLERLGLTEIPRVRMRVSHGRR